MSFISSLDSFFCRMEIDYLHGMLWAFLNAKGFLGRGLDLEKRVNEGGVLVKISVFPQTNGLTNESEANHRFQRLVEGLRPPKAVEVRRAKTKSDFDSMVSRLNFHVIPASALSTDPIDCIAPFSSQPNAGNFAVGSVARDENANSGQGNDTAKSTTKQTARVLPDSSQSSDAACQAAFQSLVNEEDYDELDHDNDYEAYPDNIRTDASYGSVPMTNHKAAAGQSAKDYHSTEEHHLMNDDLFAANNRYSTTSDILATNRVIRQIPIHRPAPDISVSYPEPVEPEQNTEYHCAKCDIYFPTHNKRARHRQLAHGIGEELEGSRRVFSRKLEHYGRQSLIYGNKNITCRTCKVVSHGIVAHRRHHYEFHIRPAKFKARQVTCSICRLSVDNRKDLKEHMKQHASPEELLLKCTYPECKFSSSNKRYLWKHIERIHKTEPKYPCILCDKIFKFKESMQRHVDQVHRGIKKHFCSICGLGCNTRTRLAEHMAGPHRYKCGFCELRFSRKFQLKDHVEHKHPGRVGESEGAGILAESKGQANYKCGFCELRFRRKKDLQDHVLAKHERDVGSSTVRETAESDEEGNELAEMKPNVIEQPFESERMEPFLLPL